MSRSKLSIDELWTRLKKYEGDKFATKKGKSFTYKISGGAFHSSRTGYNISKSEFQKALELVPFGVTTENGKNSTLRIVID